MSFFKKKLKQICCLPKLDGSKDEEELYLTLLRQDLVFKDSPVIFFLALKLGSHFNFAVVS